MYSLAGQFAEELDGWGEIRPETWKEVSYAAELEEEVGGEGDRAAIARHLRDWGDPEEAYPLVVQDTEQSVRDLWPEITAVAEALIVRRRLEGDEVHRIIASGGTD